MFSLQEMKENLLAYLNTAIKELSKDRVNKDLRKKKAGQLLQLDVVQLGASNDTFSNYFLD